MAEMFFTAAPSFVSELVFGAALLMIVAALAGLVRSMDAMRELRGVWMLFLAGAVLVALSAYAELQATLATGPMQAFADFFLIVGLVYFWGGVRRYLSYDGDVADGL